ncbi:MAG: hypothetical protein FWH47_07690 [Methanomassiliicoccaceae archaeon]|nr:hypothetical protein [Methanomassiliicoccaceae archaeon]
MVDCIAYCVRRNYRSKTPSKEEQETYKGWLEQIRCKFLGGREFDKYGIKVFPK